LLVELSSLFSSENFIDTNVRCSALSVNKVSHAHGVSDDELVIESRVFFAHDSTIAQHSAFSDVTRTELFEPGIHMRSYP